MFSSCFVHINFTFLLCSLKEYYSFAIMTNNVQQSSIYSSEDNRISSTTESTDDWRWIDGQHIIIIIIIVSAAIARTLSGVECFSKEIFHADAWLEVPLQVRSLWEGFSTHNATKVLFATAFISFCVFFVSKSIIFALNERVGNRREHIFVLFSVNDKRFSNGT